MFLNFLNKIKTTRSSKLAQVIELFQNKQYDEALLVSLTEMKQEERVNYVADFITNSHFKINAAALKIFNDTLKRYYKERDATILKNYIAQISSENRGQSISSHTHMFLQIRTIIVQDLLLDQPQHCAESIIQTYRIERHLLDEDDDMEKSTQKYVSTVIDVITKVWPKKSMLKVLYG